MRRDNPVAFGGLKEKWNVHVMLVAKTEGKVLEYSKI